MTITTIQLVDTDLSTVTFDLHSSDGTTNASWGSVITKFGLGGSLTTTVPHDPERFEHPNTDGGFTTFSRRGMGQASWRQVIAGTSEANLRLGVGRLTDLLTRGTILRVVTSTTTRYLRIEPSEYPSPYQGKELELHDIFQQFSFRQGLDIKAVCQPYWEGAEITGSAVTVPDDPATSTKVRTYPITVSGDLPTPATVKTVMDASSTVERILIANRGPLSTSQAADYLSDTGYFNCESSGRNWTITLGTNTSSSADGNASGGNVAQCTHATDPTAWRRAVRATRTTLLGSLRGSWDVYLRVSGAEADDYRIQLKWGPSTADPPVFTLPEVTFNVGANGTPSTFGYVEKNLGRIFIPETVALGGIGFEIWTRNLGADTSNLNMDFVWFSPAENQGTVVVPSSGPAESTLGKDLTTPPYKLTADPTWTAGTITGNNLKLDAANDACGLWVNAGIDLPDGRHRFIFEATTNNATGVARVVTVGGGGAGAVVATLNLAPGMGRKQYILNVDASGATLYQAQITVTAISAGGYSRVHFISHEFLPSLASGEAARTEPGTRYSVDRLDGSANLAGYLGVEGAIPTVLPPGVNHVMVRCDEVAIAYYDENENKLSRTPTVTISYFPRYAL